MKTKKALVIIDMQKGSFTSKTPRFDVKGVVNRINFLAKKFRENNLPVIFIQHDGSRWDEYVPGTPDWELLSELIVEKEDLIIPKYANDSFYGTTLFAKLKEIEVDELLITGCATDFCVESTVQSALAKDFKITVVKNGHTTGDRPHLKAEQVVDHYNWVWQNMIPTKGAIKVVDYKDIGITSETQIESFIK